jgi:hypothetical protein
MESYQCPDCLGVHEAATEPVVGVFVRCEECMLAELLLQSPMSAECSELEPAPAQAA